MSIIGVDSGGTFTDVVYERDGALHVLKVPSTPDDPARAVIAALKQIALPHARSLIHGSTVATNALLERQGARIALITNRGLEDVIEIGRQNRPQLYALSGARPAPLVERALRFGVSGRLDYTGAEIEPLDEGDIVALTAELADVDAIALCLLHSYANAGHEQRVAALLQPLHKHVSISSELLPEYREYERTSTTVANAYVAPLMEKYLAHLEAESAAQHIRIMGSAGGAVPVATARREPVQTVLSGPAGGVAGALAVARAAGFRDIISFDMGGTSTDVSLCPGHAVQTRAFTISGLPIAIPVLDIHTVGAGGGSIAWIDAAGALLVGPRSAGAQPGPICYGRGGTAVTVTDANVWLGRLPAQVFLGGAQQLDRAAIEPHLGELAARLGLSLEQTAEGILTIVNSTMEGALRVISVERGYDPIEFTLVAFGGAAGLHAADLAERLGIPRILVPPHPGVLSAYGMLASPVRKGASRTVLVRSDGPDLGRIAETFVQLEQRVLAQVAEEGVTIEDMRLSRTIAARYQGQSHELRVSADDDWVAAFHAAHTRRYGYANDSAVVEAVTLQVDAISPEPVLPGFVNEPNDMAASSAPVFSESWQPTPVHPRGSIATNLMTGPLVVTEYSATTWMPAGWSMRLLESGSLLMERG